MKLLLAHPLPIVGDGLRSGLRERLDIDVVTVDHCEALLREARSPEVLLALVDEGIAPQAVGELCSELLSRQVPMILMTTAHDGLLDVLAGGVRGVVDLRGGLDGVVAAVTAVREGLTHLPPHLLSTVLLDLIVARRSEKGEGRSKTNVPTRTMPEPGESDGFGRPIEFSPREREALVVLCAGGDHADIARDLQIAPSTAKTYISRITAKLGARSRVEAVQIALRDGLVHVEERRG